MKVKRSPSDGRIAVSKRYFLDEFYSPLSGYPNPIQIQNIFKLAAILESRYVAEKVEIYSGYQSLAFLEATQQAIHPKEINAERVCFYVSGHPYMEAIEL